MFYYNLFLVVCIADSRGLKDFTDIKRAVSMACQYINEMRIHSNDMTLHFKFSGFLRPPRRGRQE
ncbi:hypothetical protein CEE37_01730 [candidate division LCP-89 bacterium B3_LCP]|uniref:Uncharacterized protein n=1 Tax=candidate division LCP-89 bacterium B3_LCP TaxID=2012998 RepID=A0A532V635_UNCL8|nr:MAG: hypothetical protein CEE37_01730 [candidate division LCP-89 bacterium B3_LCP]